MKNNPVGHVRLYVDDLSSKWGFADGDLLYPWLEERGLDVEVADELLQQVVLRYLVPEIALRVPVMVMKWTTAHNPIRTADPDDRECDFDLDAPGIEYVDVPDECIMFEYKRLIDWR